MGSKNPVRYGIAVLMALALAGGAGGAAQSADQKLVLQARSRIASSRLSGRYLEVSRRVEWNARETAVIICDMWDRHWCPSASARVAELAPAINRFVAAARLRGVLIVHAPSETMAFYQDYPQRQAARNAPRAADLPAGMARGKAFISRRELLDLWADDLNHACDCARCRQHRTWSRQIETIQIAPEDLISDSGAEMWNVFAERGIKNVLLVGVHTNICVVGRSFGLRNWANFGFNAMLVRDLTDAMYSPRRASDLDHFSGTERVIVHIEKFICPTVFSTALTGEPPFRFQADPRPQPKAGAAISPAPEGGSVHP